MSIIKRKKTDKLTEVIEALMDEMGKVKANSQEYTAMAKNLETLCSAQGKIKTPKVSLDTIITVGGSILGIVIIVGYEKLNVVASKALGFVIKGRV
jgi:hypothetical protein